MINIISTLPFYDKVIEQNRFKENSQSLKEYNSYNSHNKMASWLVILPDNTMGIDYVKLHGLDKIYTLNLSNGSIRLGWSDNKRWAVYNGGAIIAAENNQELYLPAGKYFWEVKASDRVFFSEVIFVDSPDCERWSIKLEAWNETPWNGYFFDGFFKFVSYYNTFVTNITPTISDDTLKDGYDRQNLSQRVISLSYNISFDPMPNIIAVGLAIQMTLKNIVITDRITGNVYNVKNTKFTQTPIEGTSFDIVDLQFTLFDGDYIANLCDK